METSSSVTISTDRKLHNLEIALMDLYAELRMEGRYISAEHVSVATAAIAYALARHAIRTPGHD